MLFLMTTFQFNISLDSYKFSLHMYMYYLFQGYGFTVSQLYDLLLEIRDQYSEILMRKWVEVFHSIFKVRYKFFIICPDVS